MTGEYVVLNSIKDVIHEPGKDIDISYSIKEIIKDRKWVRKGQSFKEILINIRAGFAR